MTYETSPPRTILHLSSHDNFADVLSTFCKLIREKINLSNNQYDLMHDGDYNIFMYTYMTKLNIYCNVY